MSNPPKDRLEAVTLPDQPALAAGAFSAWLAQARSALVTKASADVACGTCTGCCTSSYFIHIGPDEKDSLARIPKALLFKAPGYPKGHVLMGYDENGHCPMLQKGKCTIYAHRPQTCRDYDCRVFAAAGTAAGDDDKQVINQRVAQWRFDLPTDRDSRELRAVRLAAGYLREHAGTFPSGFVPTSPTQLALLAMKVYEAFLAAADTSTERAPQDQRLNAAVVAANEQFDRLLSGGPHPL